MVCIYIYEASDTIVILDYQEVGIMTLVVLEASAVLVWWGGATSWRSRDRRKVPSLTYDDKSLSELFP